MPVTVCLGVKSHPVIRAVKLFKLGVVIVAAKITTGPRKKGQDALRASVLGELGVITKLIDKGACVLDDNERTKVELVDCMRHIPRAASANVGLG